MKKVYMFVLILMLAACKETEYGSLTVSLKDGPADYQEVNVEIESIEVYIQGTSKPAWYRLATHQGIYNLLQFQSTSVLLAQLDKLPAGKIEQVRITFGNNNSLKWDGALYALRLPLQPGESKYALLVPAGFNLQGKSTLHLIIDIDAERSIVRKSKVDFVLEPVAISGIIGAPLEIF